MHDVQSQAFQGAKDFIHPVRHIVRDGNHILVVQNRKLFQRPGQVC